MTQDESRTAPVRRLWLHLRPTLRPTGIHVTFAVVVGLLAELALETARTGGNGRYIAFLVTSHPGVFLVAALVLGFMAALVVAVTGRMWLASAVVLSIVTVLGVASHVKWVERREPIYPGDLVFMMQPRFLLEMVQPRVLWLTLAGLAPIIVFSWGLSRLFKRWLRRRPPPGDAPRWRTTVVLLRVAGAGLSLVALSSLLHFNHADNPWRESFQAVGADWKKASQPNNYRVNGFVGGFLSNLDIPAMKQPPDYSRATMERIVAKYATEAEKRYGDRDPHALDHVNIISVLSESFSDPTRLRGMKLAENPVVRTQRIMRENLHGDMLTLKIGSGTSTMEFETLTGMSMSQFNPSLDTPYQQLLPKYRSFPSAVEMFNQLGHTTLAIHPFSPTMYQRDKVYPILGFSRFISANQMRYRRTIEDNPYISDASAFRQVLDAIRSNRRPVFVNLVTMQNHMPFLDKYHHPITVTGLSESDAAVMGQYARGISYTDEALSEFVRAVDRSKEKTVVVFYGDHLPAGTPTSLNAENSQRTLHETPFFVHANFGTRVTQELPTTSPIFFLPRALDLAGAPLSPYYTMLRDLESQVSALEPGVMIGADDVETTPASMSPKARALLHDYRLVEYDLAVGKRYSERMLYPLPAGTVEASGAGQ